MRYFALFALCASAITIVAEDGTIDDPDADATDATPAARGFDDCNKR